MVMMAKSTRTRNGPTIGSADDVQRFLTGKLFTRADETFFLPLRLRLKPGELKNPYAEIPWVYAAIVAKAEPIGGVRMRVMRGDRDDEDNPPVPAGRDDPWQRLLDRPNPMMSGSEFMAGISTHLDTAGRALVFVFNNPDATFDPNRPPTEAWLLPNPREWKPVVEKNVIVAWENGSGPKKLTYAASQVVAIQEFNPHHPWEPVSPLDPLSLSLRADKKAVLFQDAFMDNGADPGGVLMTELDLTTPQKESIRTAWEARHRGATKRGRIAILEGGLKYEPIEVSHEKMQFVEQREWTREEILAVFRVPKLVVGLIDDVNRNTAEVTMRMFWNDVLVPRLRKVARAFTNFFFDRRDLTARERVRARRRQEELFIAPDLSEVEALQEDLDGKLKQGLQLQKLGYGLNAINTRLGLDMEDVEWGEEPLEAPNKVPISALHDEPGAFISGPAGAPAAAAAATVELTKAKRSHRRRRAWMADYQRQFFHPAERQMLRGGRSYLRRVRREQMAAIAEWAREREGEAGVRAPGGALPSITQADIDAFLLRADRWGELAEGTMRSPIGRVTLAAIGQLGADLGGFDVVTPNLRTAWVRRHGLRRLAQYVRLAKKDRLILRQVLLKAIGEGGLGDVRAVQRAVNGFFKRAAAGRALTIARTETGILANGLRHEGMKREGVQKTEWVNAGDLVVRPEEGNPPPGEGNHRAIDGDVVPLGEKFANGLRYPLDPLGAAAEVINCRCTAAPVLEDEE